MDENFHRRHTLQDRKHASVGLKMNPLKNLSGIIEKNVYACPSHLLQIIMESLLHTNL